MLTTYQAMDMDRRRISEELRKKRIFNAKERQIGLDIETLNHQAYENHLTKIRNAERENILAEEAKKSSALALSIEQQKKQEIRNQCRQIDAFRLSVQRPENSRDFDLFDPKQKKKERPPRISDKDYCPISGIQRLDGEDLDHDVRLKKQKNQNRDILLQQILEKQMQNLELKEAERSWETSLLDRDNYALQFSHSDHNDRKNASKQLEDDNKNLAWLNQEFHKQQKIRDELENKKDIEFQYHGEMLAENPSVARNHHQSHRILPDRWKGMTKAQLEGYYKGQIQQIWNNQTRREQEQQKEREWNKLILDRQHMLHYLDDEENRKYYQFCKQLELENQQLAQQQRQHQEYFNKVINTNVPTKKYFNQFSTSSR
ncbi:RIB43A-like with coiled-coils protein 2 [Trichonephila clavata]|uniref:RIB43A-like with coiled-coils protein 2 n=1 Tax=Trichonephila clavata TaxID=2740835 RepID=A0A8X6JFC5_TRICU|nr:RIB43A-like with coiled-coils protein 2 [Trichonephila clavata]